MAKRRITKKQIFRIKKLQEGRLQRAQRQLARMDEGGMQAEFAKECQGLVIAHYGTYIDVEDAAGAIYRCHIRQNIEPMIAGDQVIFRYGKGKAGVIEALVPRFSVLARSDERGQLKPIAANIDQIIIVIAVEPWPVLSLVDSYLVAVENAALKAVIILNKTDRLDSTTKKTLHDILNRYGNLGYAVYTSSIQRTRGLAQLKAVLTNHTSIFVGQSGVGKSSLINHVIPTAKLAVGTTSVKKHGVHTTVQSKLFHLPFGGNIIDSPGIREFGLWHFAQEEITHGFIEFRPYLGHCKFRNCRHKQEVGCAILAAVEQGLIAVARLESYYALLEVK
jgi:ribosome biogenesis GTPase